MKFVIHLTYPIDYSFGLSNNEYYKNNKKDINQKIFSQRLKELRKEFNLTQEKLAKNHKHKPFCYFCL